MSNGFTNLPTSLLGTVNIGGSLSVAGALTVGPSPNIVRVGNFTGYGPGISGNLQTDAATRDNAGVTASLLALGGNGNAEKHRIVNAAGNAMDQAEAAMIAVDHAVHVHTGTVTEDTIVSKVIRANRLGAHGGMLIDVVVKQTAIIAGGNTFRLRLGGIQIFSMNLALVDSYIFRLHLFNAGATNAQSLYGYWLAGTTTTINMVSGTSAIDTTADATLLVSIQSGNVGNSQQVEKWAVHAANSFGVV